MAASDDPQEGLPEVERLHRALARLPGAYEVQSGIESLHGLEASQLGLVDFGHLPVGALRRTNGGLAYEALAQFQLRLEQTRAGWRSLEFLAWFIRDQARGGIPIQLRPYALPPMGHEVQLGRTLLWHIDLFCLDATDDLKRELVIIDGIAQDLETFLRLYHNLLYPIDEYDLE